MTDKNIFPIFRLQINIQSGAALKPRDDVMLHISVRPQENVIVRNHFQNQNWGAEERYGGNPIQAHQSFEIAITAEHAQYRIAINNQHYCTFVHRLPVNLAQYVSISGTCTVAYITNDQTGPSPGFPPTHVRPHYPIATPAHPSPYPIHHNPPPPPPMPMPTAPPPYPGHYPGHHHPTPYTVFKHELQDKMHHLKRHDHRYHDHHHRKY